MIMFEAPPEATERHNDMRALKPRFTLPPVARLLGVAMLLATAGTLAGCANKDGMTTGSIPDDYRTRHPISLTEVEHTIDVPVASGDRRLPLGSRDAIAGFASDYRLRSSGTLKMLIPQGAYNSGASAAMRKEIRGLLAANGVPMPRIVETSYQAGADGELAPIRLSYVAMSAVTEPCGEWPEDLANNTLANRNWHNFGCATQSNLAAQIENPMDLVAPRKIAPVDATQRANVISVYREAASGTTQ